MVDLETPPPVVAVHTAILYETICHSCGWSSGLVETIVEADREATDHRCLLTRQADDERPSL